MPRKPRSKRNSRSTGKKPSVAPAYVLPRRLKNLLPSSQRADASSKLWAKSGGLCHLCGEALQAHEADADHVIPVSEKGATKLANLYLAHRACNRARGALPLEHAKPLVTFKVFCESNSAVTYDHVIDNFVIPQFGTSRQSVGAQIDGSVIRLKWKGISIAAPLHVDPATGTKYFFADVPCTHVLNDKDVQPRLLTYAHVRELALDFRVRPVHEPSNCRLILNAKRSGVLLQFDGQHKSTAQVLLGRPSLQMKVYIEPEIAMIQALVVKIQQEIKKAPLTRSDTLTKLGDVIREPLDAYLKTPGKHTEVGFIDAQPTRKHQKTIAALYRQELQRLVFHDDTNALAQAVKPGAVNPPTTDRVVIDKIIKPLLHGELLDIDLEASGGRDRERELILLILNTIAEQMLVSGWSLDPLRKRRAANFFYQASIGWWMEQLQTAIRYVLQRFPESTPLFTEDIDLKHRNLVEQVVVRLTDLAIWSTEDQEITKAMRSNTVANLKPLLPSDTWREELIP